MQRQVQMQIPSPLKGIRDDSGLGVERKDPARNFGAWGTQRG